MDQLARESMNVGVGLQSIPVQPVQFIVLAIRIVVAQLRTPNFITHQQHGNSEGQQIDGKEVLDLPLAKFFDLRIIRRSLDAAIPTDIMVVSVAIVFVVGKIVLFVVRDQIIQREAVMSRHKVDALFRFTSPVARSMSGSFAESVTRLSRRDRDRP